MKIEVAQSKYKWFALSGAIIGIGLIAMVISMFAFGSPLKLGLDFTGGTLIQLNFPKAPEESKVRSAISAENLPGTVIQKVGDKGIAIRTKRLSEDERIKLQDKLKSELGAFTVERVESVGPILGQELLVSGLLALVVSLAGILIYLAFRFQLDYAVCASLALFHDVLIMMGVFSILGLVFGTEVDALFVVAMLTIIGFSVQDTVVVYDRVRENLQFISRKKPFAEIVNDSVNQTLARSINTTVTVLLVLVPLYIFGGTTLRDFAFALIVGFIIGAYSSIFTASALLIWWRERNTTSTPPSQKAKASV